jgi:putative serine protease PepD
VYDSKGDIVTNEHVVSGATSITVTLWNGKTFKGHLVGSDSSTDLAVVRISAPASMLTPLQVGNSDAVQVGSPVVAIGSPFGLSETVTSGIVSALGRSIDAPNNFTIVNAIQTDAPINHGNSGGPLLNSAGQVIGINAQIQSSSGGSEGVGFAIPSNTVRSTVSQIVAGKTVAHAYLGVRVGDSLSPLGATLAQVLPGTPAAKAGLESGDVVVKLDTKAIQSAADVSSVIDGKKPGDTMKVTYVRGGKTATATVTLGTRPS